MSYFLFVVECRKSPKGWRSSLYNQLEAKIKITGFNLVIHTAAIRLDGCDLIGCTIHDGVSSERLFKAPKSIHLLSIGQRFLKSLQQDNSVETFFTLKWIHNDASGFFADSKDTIEIDLKNTMIPEKELKAGTVFFLLKERNFGSRWIKDYA
ncbi:MAG: hypothetical protein IPN71_03815 [Fibrobacteres bacterium]|nr:hypothetical protein [Fibrobacterota bacterium]